MQFDIHDMVIALVKEMSHIFLENLDSSSQFPAWPRQTLLKSQFQMYAFVLWNVPKRHVFFCAFRRYATSERFPPLAAMMILCPTTRLGISSEVCFLFMLL